MSVNHMIDDAARLIKTTVSGEAVDTDFIEAIRNYQQQIKGHADYLTYNEVVDFSNVTKIKLTFEGLKRVSRIATGTDLPDHKTKLALIVNSSLAFGLARMYATYRSLDAKANKDVSVFKSECDAYNWLESEET